MHVRELAKAHTVEAIGALAQIMRGSESDRAKVAAAEALLNRAWGKPEQFIDIGVTVEHKSALVDKILALLAGETPKTIEHAPASSAEPRKP